MSPCLVVSRIEQMVIACEKYFSCIYRGELLQVCVRGICHSKFFILPWYEFACLMEVT